MVTCQVPESNPFDDPVVVPSPGSPMRDSLPNYQQSISAAGASPANGQPPFFAPANNDGHLFDLPERDMGSTHAFIPSQHTGASEIADPLRPQGTGASRAETNPFLRRKLSRASQESGTPASTPPDNPPVRQLQVQNTGTNPWGNSLEQQTPHSSFTGHTPMDDTVPRSFPSAALQPASAPQAPPKLPERSLLDDDIQDMVTTFGNSVLRPDQPGSSPQQTRSVTPGGQSSSSSGHPAPRSMVDDAVGPATAADATPMVETYQIKKIRWYDANSPRNPRETPILVQNVNGPCPLLALVNALTLTTHVDNESILVHTLASKEQISLDLLINAVIEEMMSEHRVLTDGVFPDPPALAAFLRGLHTGMNVNPRFTPTEEVIERYKRTSINIHPTERGDLIPGTFEKSDELELYATFGVDLIHGWLPEKASEAYAALTRQAANFEDASAKLFFEEELEGKLDDGLDPKEMEMYIDIQAIKEFLQDSGTQLTPWGIEVLRKTMKAGQFAIFFRNSHFSTLYCHPQTRELLALVTDAGYANHPEVVWESLADTTGHHTEYFSGDFRQVGGEQTMEAPPRRSSRAISLQIGSPTEFPPLVPGDHPLGNRAAAQSSSNIAASLPPTHEQVDSDLALAMQLQDEYDEEAQRQEAAAQERRRRESQLSEQYFGREIRNNPQARSQSSFTAPGRRSSSGAVQIPATQGRRSIGNTSLNSRNVPPRGSSGQRQQGRTMLNPGPAVNRPAVNRPPVNRPADNDDVPPPSYEQAASQPAFNPPTGHHAHPSSSPLVGNGPNPMLTTPLRMNGVPVAGAGNGVTVSQRQKDKCVVM